MNRLNKIILSFVLPFFCLLISVSYATETNYYNNYLDGISPYFWLGTDTYEDVYFYPQNGQLGLNFGSVVSMNNTFMNGSVPPSSIPSLNINYTVGKVFELPANSALVVYGEGISNLYTSSLELSYSTLGFQKPVSSSIDISSLTVGNPSGNQVAYGTDGPMYGNPSSFTDLDFDACYLATSYPRSTNHDVTMVDNAANAFINLLVNSTDNSIYLSTQSDLVVDVSEPYVTYDAPYCSLDDITFCFYYQGYSLSIYREANGYTFVIPNIDIDMDIYTRQFSTPDIHFTSMNRYVYICRYNIKGQLFVTEAGNIGVGIDSTTGRLVSGNQIMIPQVSYNPSYVPFYIDSLYTTQKEAIFIKDGYVSIINYDELVAKLKEAGVGQNDLTRVVELLTELNTGGETGSKAKELVAILEAYHDQLIGQADFADVTNVFDLYKNLLDFSNDMHWLITANNALFNYFAGFIMLCAMFLILNRIMR